MPHDLFGDVVARPRSARWRRSPLVFVSLATHGTMLVGLVAASIAAPGVLPFPEKVIAAYNPVAVRLVDIPLPKAPRAPHVKATSGASNPMVVREPAPTTPLSASDGVTPETGNEGRAGDGPAEPEPGDVGSVQGSRALEPPPPPAPEATAPVRLHAGIRAPRKVTDVAPVYPALAQQMRVAGVVILEATIDATGVVQSARVLRSVPLLDQAAVDAVRQWRFEPARLNDRPVAVIMTVTVNFMIGR